jgi:hypothetical protein
MVALDLGRFAGHGGMVAFGFGFGAFDGRLCRRRGGTRVPPGVALRTSSGVAIRLGAPRIFEGADGLLADFFDVNLEALDGLDGFDGLDGLDGLDGWHGWHSRYG